MKSSPPDNPEVSAQLATPGRVGRALIGWMNEDEAKLTLAARRMEHTDDPALAEQARQARNALTAREPGLDQTDLVQPLPSELDTHVVNLQQHPQAAAYFNEGWEVRLVDLTKVGSLQQTVQSEQAGERVAEVDSDDLTSIAAATLPVLGETKHGIPVQFSEPKQTWVITAPNPNLQIIGNFTAEVEGHRGFGFLIAVMPSFLQVAKHHGRYVLRDGYHRAYGLLSRGIAQVPAFVRDFGVGELGVAPTLFKTDVYLGDRPPVLPDFLNDAVAATVQIPISQKMLLIQGVDLATLV